MALDFQPRKRPNTGKVQPVNGLWFLRGDKMNRELVLRGFFGLLPIFFFNAKAEEKNEPTAKKRAEVKEPIPVVGELVKKLKTPAPEAQLWHETAVAVELTNLAKRSPEGFFPILKAPQLPQSARIREAEVRARTAVILGQAGHRAALEPLLQSCISDPDDEVREAAAKALRLLGEPVGLRRLTDIAIDRRYAWNGPRRLACIALRRWGDKEAVERLLSAFSYEVAGGNPLDPRNPLRRPQGGVGTDNPLGLPEATPAPAENREETHLYPALSALKEITGMKFDQGEKDVKTWNKWWLMNQDLFVFTK
jgi:hypothetical protein